MLDSFDKGWFVLQTYSGYENKVKENLLQRAQTYNMLENILRVEIPTQTVNVEKNGKVKEVEENRFPGYVLVEMVMTDEAWFVVRNTPNVTGFVGSHGNRSKPTPLLEEEIRQILISMGQTVDVFDTNIKVGDVVQIIDGAFMGQEGRVVEIENNKVKIMINMFVQKQLLNLNFTKSLNFKIDKRGWDKRLQPRKTISLNLRERLEARFLKFSSVSLPFF